jgi:hypothetical protein
VVNKKREKHLPFPLEIFSKTEYYALYVDEAVSPPRPVQLVWKNSPRGLSVRS